MMAGLISAATRHNWSKLGVTTYEGKLAARANKRQSNKFIVPVEYCENKDNLTTIAHLVDTFTAYDASIGDVIYSLGISLLRSYGILGGANPYIREFIESCHYNYSEELSRYDLPQDEPDILGLLYQCMIPEGVKNIQGSYFTPKNIVLDMVNDIQLLPQHIILDPCCGSLIYPLSIPGIIPEQIYAMDSDSIAVMIAKFNYFLKFPLGPRPHIYCGDYLSSQRRYCNEKFDYIITNPPWGAVTVDPEKYLPITSGETFSHFLVEAHRSLKDSGQIRFLLPESILNVKQHRDIRKYILHKTNLMAIKVYSQLFSGVSTQYIALIINSVDNKDANNTISISTENHSWCINKEIYNHNENNIFRLSHPMDEFIIQKALMRKEYDLSKSIWALGIVTGNNKDKISPIYKKGWEKIYTGKDIIPYKLREAQNYIDYRRDSLQQVAKNEFYRASVKLVYKFITQKLTFAIDETSSLVLNSANILIPDIPYMNIRTVAAFLNSELYQYLYLKLFREIKILKGNLIQLPFPKISPQLDSEISTRVNKVLVGDSNSAADLHQIVFDIYGINTREIRYIREELYRIG